MIGSTVALAAAANYPMPFVSGSSADVAIVVGDNASADLTAAAALSADLSTRFAANGGSTTTTTTTTTGELFPLFTSSTELYLNDSVNLARNILTDDDLPSVLANGDFSGNADVEFTQTINLNGHSRILFGQEPTSDDDPEVFVRLGTSAANHLYNTTIVFDQAVNFTHADSQGEAMNLFGDEWTVGADTTLSELVLYKSSDRLTLSLGGTNPTPSSTVTVEGIQYTVELVAASDTAATVRVTDSSGASSTREVDEDESKKIQGIEVALVYADESDATGTVSAEITVGSQKIILSDGSSVQVGTDETNLDGTTVDFLTTTVTDNITQIRIQTYSDDSDEDAVLAGSSFVDPVWGSLKMDFSGLNIDADGTEREEIMVDTVGDDRLKVTMTNHRGDDATFEYVNNETQSMRLAYGNEGKELIRVVEQAPLNRSMYAVVGNQDEGYLIKLSSVVNSSSTTASDDKVEFTDVFDTSRTFTSTITAEGIGTVNIGGKQYAVTYSGASGDDQSVIVRLNYPDTTGNQLVLFPTIETSKGAKVAFYQPTTLNLSDYDGAGTDVASVIFPDGDDYNTASTITLNELGNFTVGSTVVGNGTSSATVTAGTLTYNFTFQSRNTTQIFLIDPVNGGNLANPALVIFEEEEDKTDNENAMVVVTEGAGTDADGTGVSTVRSKATVPSTTTNVGNTFISLESNDDLSQIMTIYGTITTLDQSESDQASATISYPDDQVQAMIYVAEGEAVVGSGSSGALGDIVYDASEVSSVSNKNMIVLGGSCINTVAAQLLGSSSPLCGADFTANTQVGSGSFLIQSFESPWNANKVALLVAGYEAQDTINAANALKSNTVDTSEGKKYTGTTATSLTPIL